MATLYQIGGAEVYAPACPKCHVEMKLLKIDDKKFTWLHKCQKKKKPKTKEPYITQCWNCQDKIDSRVNLRSSNYRMGYICNHCGKDLSEWRRFAA